MQEKAVVNLEFDASAIVAEVDLIRRAKENDEDAWVAIYNRHYPIVHRYVRARIADAETAEDLAATVFLEALKGIGGYRDRGKPFLAWLYTITRNTVAYHHRSAYRRGHEERLSGSHGAISPPDDMSRLDLARAVDSLTGDQREVVILRYFVGFTTPEVARLLGKQERAVYSLHTRAIMSLRKRLAEKSPGAGE